MTKEEMKHAIMLVFEKRGCKSGDGMPTAFWNATFLKGVDSETRTLFNSAVDDLIDDGYLSRKPINANKSPLGSLKSGLWLARYYVD